jgi:hypothetical protein
MAAFYARTILNPISEERKSTIYRTLSDLSKAFLEMNAIQLTKNFLFKNMKEVVSKIYKASGT